MSEDLQSISKVQEINEVIKGAGESLIVPERFSNFRFLASALGLKPWELIKIQRDQKTNLPIESSFVRNKLLDKIASLVKMNKPFMLIQVDADKLKTWNDDPAFGREVGDLLIKRSTARSLSVINEAVTELGKNVSVVAVRPTHAADELTVWVFADDINDLKRVRKELDDIESPLSIDPDNVFTSTVVFSTSSDVSAQNAIYGYKARAGDAGSSHPRPYEVLKAMQKSCNDKSQFFKEVKLILSLPQIRTLLRMNITDFEKALVAIKNHHRGAEVVEKILHRLTRLHGTLLYLQEDARELTLKQMEEWGYMNLFPEIFTDNKKHSIFPILKEE